MTHPTEFGPCTWCARPAVIEAQYSRFAARIDDPVTGPSRWLRRRRWPVLADRHRRWPRLADLGDVLAGALGETITRRACRDHLPAMWTEMLQRWGIQP